MSDKRNSRNRVLNFAFNHCCNHVIEWLILRSAEAIQPLLQNAYKELTGRNLVTKQGRTYASTVQEFKTALHLRDVHIGHRVLNIGRVGHSVPRELKKYGGIYPFLERLLVQLEQAVDELESFGVFEQNNRSGATLEETISFRSGDVAALVTKANEIATVTEAV